MTSYIGRYSEYISQFKIGDKVKLLPLDEALKNLEMFKDEMSKTKFDDMYDAIYNDYANDGNRHELHVGKEFTIATMDIHEEDGEGRVYYSDFTTKSHSTGALFVFFFCVESPNVYKVDLL